MKVRPSLFGLFVDKIKKNVDTNNEEKPTLLIFTESQA
jgi:hypothetical protein